MPYEQNDAQKHVRPVKSASARAGATRKAGSLARVVARIGAIDWARAAAALEGEGHARAHGLLTPRECAALIAMYADDRCFRSRIDMGRHRFGEGDYAYFATPLPPIIATLRRELYARLAPIATAMARALGQSFEYPPKLADYTELCHRAGQTRPTPLLLRYRAGGYNRLHRDLYGRSPSRSRRRSCSAGPASTSRAASSSSSRIAPASRRAAKRSRSSKER
jgi:hypothetical protein